MNDSIISNIVASASTSVVANKNLVPGQGSNQLVLSLVSGLIGSLIGAVVGGLITFLTTRYSLQKTAQLTSESLEKTTKKTLEIEKQKQEWEQKSQISIAMQALYTETRENIESVKKWNSFRGKFRFNTESWNLYKSVITALGAKLQEDLIDSYSKIYRHNTLIDYDLQLPFGSGAKDGEIERQVNDVSQSLNALLPELEKLIN